MENRKDERRGPLFCSSLRVEYGCRRGIVSGPPRARRRPCARWLGAAAPAHLSQARRFSSSSKPGGCGTSASIASADSCSACNSPSSSRARARSAARSSSFAFLSAILHPLRFARILPLRFPDPTATPATHELLKPRRAHFLAPLPFFAAPLFAPPFPLFFAPPCAARPPAAPLFAAPFAAEPFFAPAAFFAPRAAPRGGGCALSPFAALRTQPLDLLVGRLFDPPDALGHVLRRVRLGGPAQKALALLAFGPRVLVLFHLALAPVELELVQRAAADLVLILNFRPVLRHLPSSNCGPLDTARRRFVYFSTLSHLSSVGRATVS